MSFDTVTTIFEQYGWPGLIGCAIVLAIIYFINKKEKSTGDTISKGFEKMTDTLASQNNLLVEKTLENSNKMADRMVDIVYQAMTERRVQDNKDHGDLMQLRIENSEKINSILRDILNQYNAQRVLVFEFHNSKENFNGLPFAWYDVQYEKQVREIPCISQKARSLQLDNLLQIIKKVNKADGNIVLYRKEDIEDVYEESTVLYSQLKEVNAESIIYCGLYNKDNKIVGMVVLEYDSGYAFHDDLINYYDIKAKCGRIAELLESKMND